MLLLVLLLLLLLVFHPLLELSDGFALHGKLDMGVGRVNFRAWGMTHERHADYTKGGTSTTEMHDRPIRLGLGFSDTHRKIEEQTNGLKTRSLNELAWQWAEP
jgi:hypothetical protein